MPRRDATRCCIVANHTLALADPAVVARIRAEYLEMPGMSLTLDQVVRLCGVERALCKPVLDALIETRFLSLKPTGAYARPTEESGRLRMATVELRGPLRISRRAS
jgi:hypothetical protein